MRANQIDKLMEQADKDNSGQISYDEFLAAFSYFPVTINAPHKTYFAKGQ